MILEHSFMKGHLAFLGPGFGRRVDASRVSGFTVSAGLRVVWVQGLSFCFSTILRLFLGEAKVLVALSRL